MDTKTIPAGCFRCYINVSITQEKTLYVSKATVSLKSRINLFTIVSINKLSVTWQNEHFRKIKKMTSI